MYLNIFYCAHFTEQQEEEAEERRRKEQESRKKQHAMTLEETKESIAKETQQLEVLKAKKHDLFQQLKKVLHNEDNKRKERHAEHPTYMKEERCYLCLTELPSEKQFLSKLILAYCMLNIFVIYSR